MTDNLQKLNNLMKNCYETILSKLDREIDELSMAFGNTILLSEAVMEVIIECLSELKLCVIKNGFNKEKE